MVSGSLRATDSLLSITGSFQILNINTAYQNDYNLYVNGTSYLNGQTTFGGHILPDTTRTYDIGSDSNMWNNAHVRAIAVRHVDAAVASYQSDSGLYIGYGSVAPTKVIRLYYSTDTSGSRTQFFEVNSNGAYALTRFGVNGQNTDYALYVNGTTWHTDHIYLAAAKHIYMPYNSTNYNILHNHNNGNVSLNAASAGLYMAYYNTTFVNWMNGRMELRDGCLSLFPNNSSYREGIRIHATGSWSDITLCGNDNTENSGTSANSWFLGNNNGNFYITRNGSSSGTSLFGCVGNVWKVYGNQANSKSKQQSILHIYGPTYGNTAADMIGGTAGLFSWGDGGPQITFDTSGTPGGGQAGALIYTDNDTAATGASWHFVSNQSDWNVTSKRFHARTSISIGTNLPSTSYNLSVTGTGYFSDNVTIASGKRIGCSGGSLYIGNSENQNWVYVQDMASQSGTDKWKITQAGAATFVGTVTATLFDGPLVHTATGVSYIAGAKGSNATVYAKKATGSVWRPAVVLTTAGGGAWQIGNYNDETLEFQYATKANMDSNTNSTSEIFMQNGDTGRVITSGNKGNWTFTPSSHTHDISQVTWAAGSNLVCTGANTEWSIDMQSSATGSYWHVWSAIKGGSCIQCYNDDRRVSIPVRLDTSWLRVTNDSSNNTDDATVYIQCQTANDWGLKIAKGGKDYGLRVDSLDQSNAIWTNGYIRARGVWANQGSNGERQVGTDSSTSGTIYFYSHTTGKGIYSGSGYQTGAILTINSSGKTFYGALSGNASTATTLQTARNINGTSFNGSANITTANWGTSRTITIGGTGKSVNGSGNVSWSKAEILGSSNAGSFYRGDQTWSRTLDGGFICHAIELSGSVNPYIDFHANNSSADYTVRFINAQNDGSVLTLYGSLVYTGQLVHSSSYIIKKDIKSITEEEAKRVFKLRPISYKYQEWFDRFDQPYPSFGFVAEEVLSIMPELVSIPNDYDEEKVRRKEQRPISLKEESLIPYLVKIVQMQQKQIDELKYQVKQLTN